MAGGCASLYAPHNLKPLPERGASYDELDRSLLQTRVDGHKYILEDLNARIGQRRAGGEDMLRDYCFGRDAPHQVEAPNQDLLVELCTSAQYVVAITLLPGPPHVQVTYHEPAVGPMSPIRADTLRL